MEHKLLVYPLFVCESTKAISRPQVSQILKSQILRISTSCFIIGSPIGQDPDLQAQRKRGKKKSLPHILSL